MRTFFNVGVRLVVQKLITWDFKKLSSHSSLIAASKITINNDANPLFPWVSLQAKRQYSFYIKAFHIEQPDLGCFHQQVLQRTALHFRA